MISHTETLKLIQVIKCFIKELIGEGKAADIMYQK